MTERARRSKKRSGPSLRKLHFKDKPEANKKLQISFGGCGFLGVYHIGVGKCMVDHAPHLFSEFDYFYGASAGAISAVWAACKLDPMIPYVWVRGMYEDSAKCWFRMFSPYFDLYGRLRDFMEKNLPKNAHRLCRNVVKISLTVVGNTGSVRNWLITDFNTRNELIDVVVASSFIPGYAGFRRMPKIRGKSCCDGGITSNIPCMSDPDVITVTPFSGFCDICPQGESNMQHMMCISDQPMQISSKNVYRLTQSLCPTSWEVLEELYHQGYKDCLSFLRKEGLVADPVIHKRKQSLPSSPNIVTTSTSNGGASLATETSRSLKDPPRSHRTPRRHTRLNSLTLLSNGNFFDFEGQTKGEATTSNFVSSLADVEQGLDLRGTEKATKLSMRYGKQKMLAQSIERLRWKERDGQVGVVGRIISHPIRVLQSSWNSLSWFWRLCMMERSLSLPRLRPSISSDTELDEDELVSHNGFLGRLANYHNYMLLF